MNIKKEEFIKLIEFEINNIRESIKTTGMSLWAMVLGVFALLGFLLTKIEPIQLDKSANNIVLGLLFLYLAFKTASNVLEIIAPKKSKKSIAIDLREVLPKSLFYVIAIRLLFFCIVLVALWQALSGTDFIISASVPTLNILLLVAILALAAKGFKIPRNDFVEKNLLAEILSIPLYLYIMSLVFSLMTKDFNELLICISILFIALLADSIAFKVRDLGRIEDYVDLRRSVSACDENEMEKYHRDYTIMAMGHSYQEYVKSLWESELTEVSEIEQWINGLESGNNKSCDPILIRRMGAKIESAIKSISKKNVKRRIFETLIGKQEVEIVCFEIIEKIKLIRKKIECINTGLASNESLHRTEH